VGKIKDETKFSVGKIIMEKKIIPLRVRFVVVARILCDLSINSLDSLRNVKA